MGLFPSNPSKNSTFLYLILLSVIAVLGTFFCVKISSSDWLSPFLMAGGVAAFLIFILQISKPIWNPESKPQFGVRLATVGIALTAIATVSGWESFLQTVLAQYLHVPGAIDPYLPYVILVFAAFCIWIINYYNRDKTAMGIHPNPLDQDLPEIDFKTRLKNVTESLTEDLKTIDKETNWNIQLFTPLDAEVEIKTDNGLKKKVTDLLSAIKEMKDERLFLVLGDPGSGKSVALRKLCRDLAKEVEKTGKIPVYINLKEWKSTKIWTEENPPTIEELNDFVKSNLRARDIVSAKFFTDERYERLYETGRLYFIFDSFDEIPAVMNEPDRSKLIGKLSWVIFKFLKGARDRSQGILSSRIFRKPTDDFESRVTLEIRPFSEAKIQKTLRNSLKFNESLLPDLFKNRSDLVNIARNPFMASLVSSYAEYNNNNLPENQSEIFSNYISNTLLSCGDKMKARNLSENDVFQGAIKIADYMFQVSNLDVSIREIKAKLGNNIEDIIDILKFSRIGRIGSGDDNNFTFSHRRFCEYFVVQKMLQENKEYDLSTIPKDSQWRDALVLYCEVAPEEKARQIANFCWSYIKKNDLPFDIGKIHCLRFIQDAFKTRLVCISDFKDEFTEYVMSQINDSNIITTKIAVESLAMLEEDKKVEGLLSAFKLDNTWIGEIAFKNTRFLTKSYEAIDRSIYFYFSELPILTFFRQYKDLYFIINFIENSKNIKIYFFRKLIYLYLLVFHILSSIVYIFLFRNKLVNSYLFTYEQLFFEVSSLSAQFIIVLCFFGVNFIFTIRSIREKVAIVNAFIIYSSLIINITLAYHISINIFVSSILLIVNFFIIITDLIYLISDNKLKIILLFIICLMSCSIFFPPILYFLIIFFTIYTFTKGGFARFKELLIRDFNFILDLHKSFIIYTRCSSFLKTEHF